MTIPRGGGETILIADDEENVRNAARSVLEANGYRTLLAADGAEALTIYARNSETVDALLTDLTMPLMDGLTLIRSVQRMFPNLPIIASTGEAKSSTEADLKRLGLGMALQKPYSANILLRAVHTALTALHPLPERAALP